ncbi:MAG: geranylgeranylglycerol-phosphate geranylgeranyltransferase [Crocinitomicaceae bacterium]|nr:geranylgeranylglycerol-phosphate geranylgeranyltransferase [Crocinitomicaceae bacterium]MCF8433194.1 geranylgeranylglycerol-phosphate geranylgeranyltransferase [Crocinitomicaceae bacterium]
MYFLRLIRPTNLFIIILTMYGTVYYVQRTSLFYGYSISWIDFILLVFSTCLIAAGGNIINDYFDVKADRINKPEKLIITKHIKRRWAIVSHWSFNGIAFLIGIYLSIKYSSLSFVFIHLISINLLWFYSMYFKRKVLIGNIMIAFLTALVPMLALLFMIYSPNESNQLADPSAFGWIMDYDFALIQFITFFAFVQNLAREILKDIQDIEGDKLIYVKSLPMVIGIKKTMAITFLLLSFLPVFLLFLFFSQAYLTSSFVLNNWTFLLAGVINLIILMLILLGKGNFKFYDRLIKISMLLGILSLFQMAHI